MKPRETRARELLRIVPGGRGVGFTSRTKFRIYDSSNLQETAPVPLRTIGDGQFVLGGAVIKFVNPDSAGRMGYLATNGRLLKRTG